MHIYLHMYVYCYRKIPAGTDPDVFINRHGDRSLNVMVVGGIDRLIYHIVANAPGSFDDYNVYRQSLFEPFLESRFPHQICLSDKAYPISHCLIPPYPDAEANDDASKALFNFRHSGARMERTEHIYGIWKRRFPIAENL